MKKSVKYISVFLALFCCFNFTIFINGTGLSLANLKKLRAYDLVTASKLDNKDQVYKVKTDLVDFLEVLFSFKNLEYLELYDITALPEEISNLKSLRILNLRENYDLSNINGLTNVNSLEEILLASTVLEKLPSGFGNLENLKNLELRLGTKLEDISSLNDLNKLTFLDLTGTNNIRIYPNHLNSLTHLKVSNLTVFNDICDVLARNENKHTLKRLNINGCKDLISVPAEITQLDSLKVLNLANNPHLVDLESLGGMKNLENLDLSYCNDLESLPENFSTLSNLKVLNLSYNSKLKDISGMVNLENIETLILPNKGLLQTIPNYKREVFASVTLLIKNEIPKNGVTYY